MLQSILVWLAHFFLNHTHMAYDTKTPWYTIFICSSDSYTTPSHHQRALPHSQMAMYLSLGWVLYGLLFKTHKSASCILVWHSTVHRAVISYNNSKYPLNLCVISLSPALSFSLLFFPHCIPLTHPSISDSAEQVGDKVIWLLLLWRPRIGGFFPPLLSCTARQGGVR